VPANYSGIEKAVEELGSRLVLSGHEVSVYCMAGRDGAKIKTFKGMNLLYIPTIKSKNLEMFIYTFISSVIAGFKPYDIVHYHALGPSVMSIFPRLLGKRIVVTVHGLDWMRKKWGFLAKIFLRFGEWTSSRFAHKTITVSKTLSQYYKKKYGKDPFYIPNGVVRAARRTMGDLAQTLSIEERKYLLFVGRITKEKNINLIIRAFKTLRTDMKLLIVGGSTHSNEYMNELKELSRSCNNIIFSGPIYNEDTLSRIYSNAYLFILPSSLEGLPIVLLEALSYGNAVLVSDISENLEVIEDRGVLRGFTFSAGDVVSLTEVLSRLIKSPEIVAEARHMAKELVERKYNLNLIANETLKIYESLAKA